MLMRAPPKRDEAVQEGIACLAEAAVLSGDLDALDRLHAARSSSSDESPIRTLARLAPLLNLAGRIVSCPRGSLRQLGFPAVLERADGGFLLVAGRRRIGRAHVFEPSVGWRELCWPSLQEIVSGSVLELDRPVPPRRRNERPPISAWGLFQWTPSVRGAVFQALMVALFIQFYTAISPMFLRIVVDDIVIAGTTDMLGAAAVGFSLLALFHAGAAILRGIVLQNLNNHLSWDMSRAVFRHLLRLPLPWFHRQKLSDVLSRLQSVDQIRLALSGLLWAAFDGTLALVAIVLLFFVSVPIALIALAGLLLLAIIRAVAVPIGLNLSSKAVLAAVDEQGKRIETLRAIQSIKAMAGEDDREADWLRRFASMLKSTHRSNVFTAVVGAGQGLVGGLTAIAAIYVGARAIISGDMTVGLLTAALAYLSQFSMSASNLFQQILSWRLLDVQLGRVSGITTETPEENINQPARNAGPPEGAVKVEGLHFRYAADAPLLFRGLNLEVAAGEHVAITGASGAGKSTLLKLLTGLYEPDQGRILIDGQPLSAWGRRAARKAFGMVMQDDELLAGSIADNVTFFADVVDAEWLWECLAIAGLEEDVRGMSATLSTPVGDMGAALSGGQRQRLLIARALYRRPRILVLDEATSHLDTDRERSIARHLARLSMTRIVVAHRKETICAADRALRLDGGILVKESRAAHA